ncbi:MAG: carboxypeptidase regulatory-like domain-containing protein [Acidobacteria bacterium]|nr:carboxypeptidase regulatory-like domain-containing protein [Acidobacteriota bacterium]
MKSTSVQVPLVIRGVLAAFILMLASLVSPAQSPLGTITGTVSDSQDARIPEVEVIATNVGTGIVFRARTSAEGVYAIPNLPIGKYEVSAVAQGFKTYRRTDVVLEVAQRLRIAITLELGAVAESVTISGEIPRVQTEESSLGTVVERQRIEELPLNGRNAFSLVRLVAGVRPANRNLDGFADVANQGFSQMVINGGPVYANQIYVDGGMNTVPVHNEISVVPMADSVEEFKVDTNVPKAEYGQTSGGVINLATKAGTNQFHGSLYEFFRNDSLDARNAFATQRDAVTGRIKPVLRYNQYGGTVGGPVLLPRIYNGRNRTFFFAGYEQWKHRTSGVGLATVPSVAQRGGDLTSTFDGRGNLIPVFDPATTRANPAGSGFIRDPLAGNVVPRSRMDPLSLKILGYIPAPNTTPADSFTNSLNYLALPVSSVDTGVSTIRVDHRFSDSDSMFVRYSRTRASVVGPGLAMGVLDRNARTDQRDNHNLVLTETRTLTPRLINEFKAAFTRQNLRYLHPSFGGDWPSKLGMPAIFPQDLFPVVNITSINTVGPNVFSTGIRAQHTVQLADSATLITGRHQIKMGVDQRIVRQNPYRYGSKSGSFDFSNTLTGNPLQPAGTGIGMATFLLGEVSSGSQEFLPAYSFHSWSTGLYFQDDFKLNRRLTLNLGLRYDLASEPVERWNKHSNFDPYVINQETKLPGVLTYSGATAPRHFVDRDKNNFGPRFGFAWDVTGKGRTVVRGGYGLVYLLVDSYDTQGDNSNSLGFSATTPFTAASGIPAKAFPFSQGPASLITPLGAAGGPSAFRGLGVNYQDRNAPTPYLQQWNFTIQQQLPARWTITAAYAGNKGTKLPGANFNLNQLDPSYFSLQLRLQDVVPNPFFGQIKTGGLSGPTMSRSQSLVPFPDYTSINTLANHGSSSIYHSLQVSIERRFSNGLSALLSYTDSKLINDSWSCAGSCQGGDYRLGRFNRDLDRAVDQNDVTHRMVASAVYELPFGKGKPFLPAPGAVLQHLAGGWQVNSIMTLEGGTPLMVRGSNNFTGIGYPDVVRNPALSGSERNVLRWFDTDAFRNPADWVIGNAPRTLSYVRGPGQFDVALSAAKDFRLKEGLRLKFRAEAFNALNHVNFNNPNVGFSPNRQGVNTNALFGRITSAMDARRIQLGLRLTF